MALFRGRELGYSCGTSYDDFLRIGLPVGTKIIGFPGDAFVCVAGDIWFLKLKINESLWEAKRLLSNGGLEFEKTKALLVTKRRSFKYPKTVLGR